MAIKKILDYPQAGYILKGKSEAVDLNNPELSAIVQDLKDTLLAAPNGVGLAAPQIGILKRIFVLNRDYIINDLDSHSSLLEGDDRCLVFINAKIISEKGEIYEEEGCLSVPGAYVKIRRARTIKVRAFDEHGVQFYEKFKGLASRAVQQEIDHLNGILIIDHKDNYR